MPDATRTCPRVDCSKRITGDLFACSRHWYSLPGDVRDGIWQAYRAYQRDKPGAIDQLEAAHARAFAAWGQDGPA